MASSFTLPLLPKSSFLGQTHIPIISPSTLPQLQHSNSISKTIAKFNLYEIMGGRGLCNGEQGLQQELEKTITPSPPPPAPLEDQAKLGSSTTETIPENAFEKELLGLTGGFPGGEKGLIRFIEKNPPPKKTVTEDVSMTEINQRFKKKMKAPVLPLLMPGMIALVKNRNSPYYMYCGIVQRITDGKAGVLFEGGNWDRLISFRLDELECREKGPPMVSPSSRERIRYSHPTAKEETYVWYGNKSTNFRARD